MSKRFYILTILIAVSLILAACGGGSQAPEQCADNPDETVCAVIEPGSTIKIGYAGPMTGDYSAFGIDISNAELMAVDDLNAAGGLEGFEYELLVEDTQGSPELGAAVANKYVSDPGVVAIAAHTFSGSTAAAIPIYAEALRPMLSPSATGADLTMNQTVFNRIAFTDTVQGQFAGEYIKNVLGVEKLAVLHDGDVYGKGLAEKVQDVFTTLGGEVVAIQAITQGDADYSAVLTDVGASNPEAIYFGGYYSDAAILAKDMPVAGLEDVILFSDDGTFGAAFIELAGDQAEGVYATSAAAQGSPRVNEFGERFEAIYGDPPGAVSTFTWHGYDVIMALVDRIKSVAILGEDGNLYIPRQALVDAVNGLEGYEGLTGDITCTEGECNTTGPTFWRVEDGEWVQD
ncbi:MAG: branched-chain amino acid ABC transporter substrate-binding protein [Anaerolineales bacterium]